MDVPVDHPRNQYLIGRINRFQAFIAATDPHDHSLGDRHVRPFIFQGENIGDPGVTDQQFRRPVPPRERQT